MIKARSNNLILRIWLGCFFGVALVSSAQEQVLSDDLGRYFGADLLNDDWTRHFRVGTMVAFNIKADFSMGGTFPISVHPAGVYDDGYVLRDRTGNAGGFTGYWGYENASQYDPVARTLMMHSADSFTGSSSTSVNDSPFVGFDMAYGGKLWRGKRLFIGWDFGFGMTPLHIKDNQPFGADIAVSSFTYAVPPAPFVMPTAPYNGGPIGYGEPTIGVVATPVSGPTPTIQGVVSGSRSLDVTLYTFRLGPSFHYELNRYLAASASAGAGFGIVSSDYQYDETLNYQTSSGDMNQSRNTGKFGATQTVFGEYVNATLMYHAVKNGDVYIGVQYMPMQDATVSGGGRQASLKLGGAVYFSAGVNWPF